ncbi:MAG: response regulator, partial [Bdellovibrionales bacterium]|nr:response regulator [Bdellovibrionales bacterium]
EDNGIGIDPELIPVLFDLFTQGPRGLDRSEGGLGIGLALVKLLVERHGGSVSATSPGQGMGSRFEITLPLAADLGTEKSEGGDSSWGTATTQRRILVVDDNLDITDSLGMVLKSMGHQFAIASDGASAIESVKSFKPDVILLDLGLPKMSGYDVAKTIRQQNPDQDILIIAVTGYQKDPDRLRDAGIDHHLIKPIKMDRLASLL